MHVYDKMYKGRYFPLSKPSPPHTSRVISQHWTNECVNKNPSLVHACAVYCKGIGLQMKSMAAGHHTAKWAWVVPRKGAQRLLLFSITDLSAQFTSQSARDRACRMESAPQVGRVLPFFFFSFLFFLSLFSRNTYKVLMSRQGDSYWQVILFLFYI